MCIVPLWCDYEDDDGDYAEYKTSWFNLQFKIDEVMVQLKL